MLVRPSASRVHGFTLVELMVTITIMAIMMMFAAPSFNTLVANQRVRNASYDLMSAIVLTRSQAISANTSVNMESDANGWTNGWTVVKDTTIFNSQSAFSNLSIEDSAGSSTLTYGRDGRLVAGSTKFTIKPAVDMSGVDARCLSIGLSGMPTLAKGACQ